MSNKVKVVICGKDFTLQTAESSNYVFGLARTLESRITEITDANSSASPFTAAIMVGLATLDDLNKANAKLDSIRDQSKEYVDEAGKTRLERDAAMQQVEALKSRIVWCRRGLCGRKTILRTTERRQLRSAPIAAGSGTLPPLWGKAVPDSQHAGICTGVSRTGTVSGSGDPAGRRCISGTGFRTAGTDPADLS